MTQIKKFTVHKMFNSKTVSLRLENKALVIVGPNGIGKSTVVNIFYLFVSFQWKRLKEYQFSKISISFSDGTRFDLSFDEIVGALSLDDFFNKFGEKTRTRYEGLVKDGYWEKFISSIEITKEERKNLSGILKMPQAEVNMFRNFTKERLASFDPDMFTTRIVDAERKLAAKITERVIYLPTYRRIEKDIKDVFSAIETQNERFARVGDFSSLKRREGDRFVELVSFGMEDVKKNLQQAIFDLRSYSFEQYNNLSATYLRDVIRDDISGFDVSSLRELTEGNIQSILARVDETIITAHDKKILTEKIKAIQGQNKKRLSGDDKYLAHYFSKIIKVYDDLKQKEKKISSFVDLCNSYLNPDKQMIYDEFEFRVHIISDDKSSIDFSMLSSGEKQVVSLFSHLCLDEQSNQIVIIDEPELSLSVPWQKKFLPDLLSTGKCGFLLAVTHSPFIFDNELSRAALDLREATT